MNLTPEQVALLVGAIVILANALAAYLTSRSTRKEVTKLREHVELSTRAPLVDGHNQPPVPHG